MQKLSSSRQRSRIRFAIRGVGAGLIVVLGGAVVALALDLQLSQTIEQPVVDLELADQFDQPRLQSIALADVDGDGALDLIALNQDFDGVTVRLGADDGTFDDVGDDYETDLLSPVALVVADLRSPFESQAAGAPDGIADIAIIDDTDLQVLVGDGDGGFTVDPVIDTIDSTNLIGIKAGDVDNDDANDLIILDEDAVHFLCNGDQGALDPCPTGDSPFDQVDSFFDLGVGDFNGDNNLDVVVLDGPLQEARAIYGDGTGNFEPSEVLLDTSTEDNQVTRALGVGDFDKDDVDDFAAVDDGNFGLEQIRIFRGVRGARNFVAGMTAGNFGMASVAVLDVDGDGILDLLTGSRGEGGGGEIQTVFVRGLGGGQFDENLSSIGRNLVRVAAFASGDLNGDHRQDVVALVGSGDEIRIALNVAGTEPPATATPTIATRTPTSGATPTASRTATPKVSDASCNIDPQGDPSWPWAGAIAFAVLACAIRRKRLPSRRFPLGF